MSTAIRVTGEDPEWTAHANTSSPQWFCVASIARSGTNHLFRLLERLRSFHVYLEVFEAAPPVFPAAAFDALASAIGQPMSRQRDPALGRWIHEHIGQTLDILERSAPAGTRFIGFKIFHDHLAHDEIESHLIKDRKMRFLIVKRRPIDTFISFKKALHIGAWLSRNTTALRLPIDADEFALWHESRSDWFVYVESLLKRSGNPYSVFRYEDDILEDDIQTLERVIEHLRRVGIDTAIRRDILIKRPVKRLLAAIAKKAGLESPWDPALGIGRQDLNVSLSDKVENWAGFLDRIERNYDRRMLNEYFVHD